MKFEIFLLRSLFIACFAVCALIMGSMLNDRPPNPQHTGASPVDSTVLTAPTMCAMKPYGVVCPVSHS